MKDLVVYHKYGYSTGGDIMPEEDMTIDAYVEFIRARAKEYKKELEESYPHKVEQLLVHHRWNYESDNVELVAYRKHTEKELAVLEKRRKSDGLRKLKAKNKSKENRLKKYEKLKKEFG